MGLSGSVWRSGRGRGVLRNLLHRRCLMFRIRAHRHLLRVNRQSLRIGRSQGGWLVRGQLLPTLPRGLRIIRSTSRASSHFFAYPFAQIAHRTLVTQRGSTPQIGASPPLPLRNAQPAAAKALRLKRCAFICATPSWVVASGLMGRGGFCRSLNVSSVRITSQHQTGASQTWQ